MPNNLLFLYLLIIYIYIYSKLINIIFDLIYIL